MERLDDELVQAARDQDLDRLKALIDAGADVNALPVTAYYNALHAAIEHSDPREESQELLRYLLSAGADPESVCGSLTALQHAIDLEADAAHQAQDTDPPDAHVTRALLDAGASPTNPGVLGETPLQLAQKCAHNSAVKLLIAFGASDAR